MKKKIQIEYALNPASGNILWGIISTPSGLQRWFADKVTREGRAFTFQWGKDEIRRADLISSRSDSFVRFRWSDENDRSYFELRILQSELTNDFILEVTDFAEPDEAEDMISLWDSQVEQMRRVCGV